jgi:hypothetical protein
MGDDAPRQDHTRYARVRALPLHPLCHLDLAYLKYCLIQSHVFTRWQVVLSRAQSEGVGATVRRSIGNAELRNHDPFLMLDEFQLNSKPGAPTGFPDHPHRGAHMCSRSARHTSCH